MNIGVIGSGTIASWMSDFLGQISDRGIVKYGVASDDMAQCRKFAAENGWAYVYNSVEELLGDPAVDLVYIAVPNNAHYDMCMKALDCGKNVVVEKPFAVNDKQAEAMFARAKEKDVFISEALWPSFLPSCALINQVIASGEIGELTGGKMVSLADVMFLDRVKKLETGGGALMDMGSYMVGRVTDHFGCDIVSVKGRFELLETGVDARDRYTIEYANGVKVDCVSTINTPRSEFQEYGEIYGTKGSIWFDGMPRLEANVRVQGKWPRGAALSPDGKLLTVSCLVSGDVLTYRIGENGIPAATGHKSVQKGGSYITLLPQRKGV